MPNTKSSLDVTAKRKVIPGKIEALPNEIAISVKYSYLDSSAKSEELQKIIKLQSLAADSNVSEFAADIIEKCKLIQPNRINEVEQQLIILQERIRAEEKSNPKSKINSIEGNGALRSISHKGGQVDLNKMDDYVEAMYEDIPERIKATRAIAELASHVENLEQLASNDALLNAITRVLKEDGKKSLTLISNVIYTFYAFSCYPVYHPIITEYKMGDACLKIIDAELRRHQIWLNDIKALEIQYREKKKDKVIAKQYEDELNQFQEVLKDQEILFLYTFKLLHNLAEDVSIEIKMVKRSIVEYLITLLDRDNTSLLITLIVFLRKLSIYKENKNEMKMLHNDIQKKFVLLLNNKDSTVVEETMKLMVNLALDHGYRSNLLQPHLTKFLTIAQSTTNHNMALKLLYMFSMDAKSRPGLASSGTPIILKLVLENKGDKLSTELGALFVNLALDEQCALVIVNNGGFKFLMKKAIKTKDPILFKAIFNLIIALSPSNTKINLLDYIDDIIHLITVSPSGELHVILYSILGSIDTPNFNFAKLAQSSNLLDMLYKRIGEAASSLDIKNQDLENSKKYENDDIILASVILLGTMAIDDGVATLAIKSNLLVLTVDLLKSREDDAEIVLQVLFCCYRFLKHKASRAYLLAETKLVSYLISFLTDEYSEIRKLCDCCLDLISEYTSSNLPEIRAQKFMWHNAEWISIITGNANKNL